MPAISKRDREVFLVSTLYFWFMYLERALVNDAIMARQNLETRKWADEVLSKLPKATDAVGFFVDRLFANEKARQCFVSLEPAQVKSLLNSLNNLFGNQEFCARCECWSYFNVDSAEDFAYGVAADMLGMLSFSGDLFHSVKPGLTLPWFENISAGKIRRQVLTAGVSQALEVSGLTLPKLLVA